MKRVDVFNLFFFWILLIINGCVETEEQINDKLEENLLNRKKVNSQPDSTNNIIMIYDYDAVSSKLRYRPIKIQNPSGDYLKDALNTFLENNHFLDPDDLVRFERIENINGQTVFYFSGLENSNAKKDKSIFFKKALELTISRNFQELQFKVELLEDYP